MAEYVINGEHFKTKKALESRVKSVLHNSPLNTRLNESDTKLLYWLLERHPFAKTKMGPGVAYMEVRENSIYRTRSFWIVRVDGTGTDFSYREALRPSTPEAKFRLACRSAVAPYIAETKANFWVGRSSAICPLTGLNMSFEDSHVHHTGAYDFSSIMEAFINQEGIDVNTVEFIGERDNVIGDYFKDQELERRFVDFHNSLAELQVVSKEGNQSAARASAEQRNQQPRLL